MDILLTSLLNEARTEPGAASEPFKPIARYYPAMDFVLYLNEDVSYRADRVDQFLTVLYHPYNDRLVGIKLKGFRFLFERVKAIADLKDEHFMPLVKAIETALVGGMAESIMKKHDHKRVRNMYEQAIEITTGVSFDSRELGIAA